MKSLNFFANQTTSILTNNDLLNIRGGANEEDPKPTKEEKPEDKKDDRQYVTIDTEFDFWLEPEI